MGPDLSRRAARVMLTRSVQDLGLDGRQEFVMALEVADNFADLTLKWRRIIMNAEREQVIRRTVNR